jgi:hypothetical protein
MEEEEEVAIVGYMNSDDWWIVLPDSKIIGRGERNGSERRFLTEK